MPRQSLPNKNARGFVKTRGIQTIKIDCLYLGDIIKADARRCLWQLIGYYTLLEHNPQPLVM